MQTPILTTPPPLASVGEQSAEIAVAVLSFVEPFTSAFSNTIGCALSAGLRRDSVPVISRVSFYIPIFHVTTLTVPWALRGAAVESLKNALKELELSEVATIASRTADASWLSVHGLDLGGINFDKAFLRPEYMEQCIVAVKKLAADSELMAQHVANLLKAHPKTAGENPEPK